LGRAHDDRQHVVGVRGGQIGDPQNPRRTAQLEGGAQQAIEGVEDGHLEQQREAASRRVDPVLLVERHHLVVHLALLLEVRPPLLVLQLGGVAGANRLHLGIQLLHLLHRLHAVVGERQEGHLDQHGHQDDRPAVVAHHVVVQPVDAGEERTDQNAQHPPVDRLLQAVRQGFQRLIALRPPVGAQSHLVAGRDQKHPQLARHLLLLGGDGVLRRHRQEARSLAVGALDQERLHIGALDALLRHGRGEEPGVLDADPAQRRAGEVDGVEAVRVEHLHVLGLVDGAPRLEAALELFLGEVADARAEDHAPALLTRQLHRHLQQAARVEAEALLGRPLGAAEPEDHRLAVGRLVGDEEGLVERMRRVRGVGQAVRVGAFQALAHQVELGLFSGLVGDLEGDELGAAARERRPRVARLENDGLLVVGRNRNDRRGRSGGGSRCRLRGRTVRTRRSGRRRRTRSRGGRRLLAGRCAGKLRRRFGSDEHRPHHDQCERQGGGEKQPAIIHEP